MIVTDIKLAIEGGNPVRSQPMPARYAIGESEQKMIQEVFAWYHAIRLDPGYQGHFEEEYCNLFAQKQGGGYADAVATGTAALFVAIAALELPKGSEILVSPITDPGTLSAIILQGHKPKLLDTKPDSFNTDIEHVKQRLDANTKCVLIVHAAGEAVEISAIVDYCHQKGVKVIEDCSQSHGAKYKNKPVGSFGDIAAFSTMYRKASITGPTGGVVYTSDKDLYYKVLAHADRGKPSCMEGFNDRDPSQFLFPALNFHSNEISCGIGIASLSRLDETINKRLQFLMTFSNQLSKNSTICRPYGCKPGDSPFYYPIFVDKNKISCSKIEFAKAVQAEGIGLNPHYEYLVEDWPWIKTYLVDDYPCINARNCRDNVFCLYVNENYGGQEVEDIVEAILKVENFYKS